MVVSPIRWIFFWVLLTLLAGVESAHAGLVTFIGSETSGTGYVDGATFSYSVTPDSNPATQLVKPKPAPGGPSLLWGDASISGPGLDFTVTMDFPNPWTFNGVQLGGLNSAADGNVVSFQFLDESGASINASSLAANSTSGFGAGPWAYDVVNNIWRYASDNSSLNPHVASLNGTVTGVKQMLANIDRSSGQDSLFGLDLTVPTPSSLQQYVLDVKYTGPLQLIGILLPTLPSSVHGRFVLEGNPQATTFGLSNVVSAYLPFADGVWTDLEYFAMERDPLTGAVTSLNYGFNPISTPSFIDGITLNFPLTISGTDRATGEPFMYQYTNSELTLTAVPEPSSLTLAVCGTIGLLVFRRKRQLAKRTEIAIVA